ncbi:MAG: ABC transporter permease [Gemmatimonadota bacterium]
MKDRPTPRRVFRIPLRRSRVARDVDEELRFHLEKRREDLLREGWSEEDALREARRQFGNLDRVREECRRIGMRREGEMRIADLWDGFRQDLSFALRQLVKAPGTSALSLLTLALGIGAATVVFSVVNAVVLEAVPFEGADELVTVREVTPQGNGFSVSDPNYLDWTERQHSFGAMGAFTMGDMTLTGAGQAERLSGLRVTHTVLPTLEIDPIAGRHMTPEEDVPDAGDRVVLLARGYWESRFGADESLVDGTLTLDGIPHLVIGVVPTDRGFPGVDIFTPLRPDPASDRGNHMLQTVARLAPGTTLSDAQREMAGIGAALAEEYPDANAGWGAGVYSLQDWRVGDRLTRIATFLVLAVALLLLMACGSVANVLIARATGRQREIGLRAALGAGRRRIVAQLLTESAVLGILGGALGVVLARVGTPVVRALGPRDLARLGQATMDGRVLAVAVAVSVTAVLVSGLAPALFATRGRLFDALREGAPSTSGPHRRVRDALVVAQFALAVVVILGAGLMTRSFQRIQAVDLGFPTDGAFQFSLGLPDGEYSTAERVAFLERLTNEIQGLPGAEAAGVTMSGIFSEFQASNMVAPAEEVPDRQEEFIPVSWRAVDDGFFSALGIQLLSGRNFDARDQPPESQEAMADGFEIPVILDDHLAEDLWGAADAVGRSVVWNDPSGPRMRVVGVVRSIRDESVRDRPRPRVYLPYTVFPWPTPSVVVRTAVDPAGLVPAVRSALQALDSDVPMMEVATLPEVTRERVAWPRFTMQVVSAFGLLAVILAAMGVYGVASFGVLRRRREIGIRIALGAESGGVVGLVLRQAVRLALAGIVVGVVVALAAGRFIGSLLYEVAPADPATFTVLPLGLAVVALLASWGPARRATKVDPRSALTTE